MYPLSNPFAPGAGAPPPELAGRGDILNEVDMRLQRLVARLPMKSVILIGLRGVGKTVLLERVRQTAEGRNIRGIWIEVPEGRSLPAILAPQIRVAMLALSRPEQAKRALRALAGFVAKFRVKYNDVEVGVDYEPEPGLADSGDLEADLAALLVEAGKSARAAATALVFFMDELQYVEQIQFAALISALHRCTQMQLPVTLVGAGLPQLRALAGQAKTYAERLFDFPEIGALGAADARIAIARPIEVQGAAIEPAALEMIVQQTQGYPYFLQEWGKFAWSTATESPITRADVEAGSRLAVAALDESFFRVRFDRLTPAERRYLRAMAELGPGAHRSGEVAAVLARQVQSLGPTRNTLIHKGMAWSPAYGDVAFTVPLFDAFMKRIMPGDEWREVQK
ncbi:MAG: ATP-binding protein [Terriglobales bacterium]